MSETVLARALHLLTLGAYAWENSSPQILKHRLKFEPEWKSGGGGEKGSIFYRFDYEPTAKDWVEQVLLAHPEDIMDSQWYSGEENCLLLLNRLACDGGFTGAFTAQDKSIRGGASWLCDFAAKNCAKAACLLGKGASSIESKTGESALQKRRRKAEERAMKTMKANADKFAAMMKTAGIEEIDERKGTDIDNANSGTRRQEEISNRDNKLSEKHDYDNSKLTSKSNMPSRRGRTLSISSLENSDDSTKSHFLSRPVSRLFEERPKCIICSDDGHGFMTSSPNVSKSSKTDKSFCPKENTNSTDSVLALCGYAQASTVLKCGGGVPTTNNIKDPLFAVQRLVGTHVSLCGHAMHSSCYESYMKTVAQRDDRTTDRLDGGKKGEFKCPLCQRLSNCLVPFIDVGVDWIGTSPSVCQKCPEKETSVSITETNMDQDEEFQVDLNDDLTIRTPILHEHLGRTPWWSSRNDKNIAWDGRCTFIPLVDTSSSHVQETGKHLDNTSQTLGKISLRKSVRSFGKKDLYMAWNTVMKTPRFVSKHQSCGSRSSSPPNNLQTFLGSSSDNIPSASSQGMIVQNISTGSSPVTDVWRKLMDQLSSASVSADSKRLGEDRLLLDYGEFRHYLVERAAYNVDNRIAGKESVDVSKF